MASNNNKRVLVLTDWFAPGYKAGGPIQSCVNFCLAMKDEYEIYVLSKDTDLNDETPYQGIKANQWVAFSNTSVHVYYFSKQNLRYENMQAVINQVKPDFIYLNHMFSLHFVIFPLWMHWRGKLQSKIIICPRGALYHSAMHHQQSYLKKITFIYIAKWLGLFKSLTFQATSEREKDAIQYYFLDAKIIVANNFSNRFQNNFATLEKSVGALRIIFIARVLPIKNLLFFLEVLCSAKASINFTIVGPIEDTNYWVKCQRIIAALPPNISVEYVGAKANNELDALLRNNHLYVLPTVGENFGHSIFEAFLSGRPVLISDQTPWKNLEEQKIGWDIALINPDQFIEAIEKAASWSQPEFDEYAYLAWDFARVFNSESGETIRYKELFS